MPLLTRKEAAARLGVSLVTLDAERSAGNIGYIQSRPGAKVFFREDQLEKYLARCTHPAKPVSATRDTYRKRQVRRYE